MLEQYSIFNLTGSDVLTSFKSSFDFVWFDHIEITFLSNQVKIPPLTFTIRTAIFDFIPLTSLWLKYFCIKASLLVDQKILGTHSLLLDTILFFESYISVHAFYKFFFIFQSPLLIYPQILFFNMR